MIQHLLPGEDYALTGLLSTVNVQYRLPALALILASWRGGHDAVDHPAALEFTLALLR